MRVWLIAVLTVMLMTGCGGNGRFETVADTLDRGDMVPARKISLQFPKDAYTEVFESSEAGSLYLCDNYEISLQTFPAGDLDRTLREICGFSQERLTLLKTAHQEMTRYDCVWSTAGETGECIGRAAILDDGNYHYTITVMADADYAGSLQEPWQALFDSFQAISTVS